MNNVCHSLDYCEAWEEVLMVFQETLCKPTLARQENAPASRIINTWINQCYLPLLNLNTHLVHYTLELTLGSSRFTNLQMHYI